jgi:diguanylate cyclase (GGDEF)-like protein
VSDDFLDPRLAERLTRAARAAQTLSETLWEALHEELSNPRVRRVAELSEQLGELTSIVASLARADVGWGEAPVAPVQPEPRVPRMADDEPLTRDPSASPPPTPPWESPPSQEPPLSPAVLVDELAPEKPPQIEIRDVRGEDGAAAWVGSIGHRLERYAQDSSPFAVLLVEVVDIERLRRAEPASEVSRLTSQVQDALARGLRPADSLTREGPGRYWLLAPQTDVSGAQLLAERIARAVRSSASHRGTPLEVAVGISVCPDDGKQASELAAHADVELYAARAAGRSSIR